MYSLPGCKLRDADVVSATKLLDQCNLILIIITMDLVGEYRLTMMYFHLI